MVIAGLLLKDLLLELTLALTLLVRLQRPRLQVDWLKIARVLKHLLLQWLFLLALLVLHLRHNLVHALGMTLLMRH